MADEQLTAELVVRAYAAGAFPMADGRGGPIAWYRPDPRAILPLDDRFHVSRSLARRVRSHRFNMTHNQAFEDVIRACAAPRPGHPETWINDAIIHVFTQLHHHGLAHSIEAWLAAPEDEPPRLAGGIYGVALGGAFFGESMFSRVTDASKVCLVHLVEHLRRRGYVLFDVQFVNPHLEQFGVIEIPGREYLPRLREAISLDVTWDSPESIQRSRARSKRPQA